MFASDMIETGGLSPELPAALLTPLLRCEQGALVQSASTLLVSIDISSITFASPVTGSVSYCPHVR